MEGQGGGDEVVGDPISVFTTSWRVGDVIPDDIEEWIPDPDVETFDLYAFALHDLSYTSLTSPPVSRAHRTSVDGAVVRDHHLTKLIRQRLGDAYRTVQEVNVDATLRLVVFAHYAHTARAAIRPDVRVATASGRSMEGTAAAAISMHFYDTYLGFVALTFPPAPDAVSSAVLSGVSSLPLKEAYADSKWSLAKVAGRGKRRGKKEGEEGGAGVAAKHVAAVAVEAEYMLNGLRQQLGSVLDVVNDPDICLMMGSFNLPLLTSPSLAMDMALSRDWGQLLDLDCFRHAWSEGLLLNGLSDPLVMYAPTYKAARASHLELMDDAAPSFADRVLWKARPGLNVDPESVAAVLNVDTSDYKPVRSFLNITTRRKLNAAERTYKVQPNDTLHTISERFRVDPRMLGRTNGVRNNIELVIGRALRIPPAKPDPSVPFPVVRVSGLSCSHLNSADLNGKADPLVQFIGEWIDSPQPPETVPIRASLNPVWPDREAPDLRVKAEQAYMDPRSLASSYLAFRVVDYDVGHGANLMIGYAVVPLVDVVRDGTMAFRAHLTANGVPAGTLSAVLSLDWDSGIPAKQYKRYQKRHRRAQRERKKLQKQALKGAEKTVDQEALEEVSGLRALCLKRRRRVYALKQQYIELKEGALLFFAGEYSTRCLDEVSLALDPAMHHVEVEELEGEEASRLKKGYEYALRIAGLPRDVQHVATSSNSRELYILVQNSAKLQQWRDAFYAACGMVHMLNADADVSATALAESKRPLWTVRLLRDVAEAMRVRDVHDKNILSPPAGAQEMVLELGREYEVQERQELTSYDPPLLVATARHAVDALCLRQPLLPSSQFYFAPDSPASEGLFSVITIACSKMPGVDQAALHALLSILAHLAASHKRNKLKPERLGTIFSLSLCGVSESSSDDEVRWAKRLVALLIERAATVQESLKDPSELDLTPSKRDRNKAAESSTLRRSSISFLRGSGGSDSAAAAAGDASEAKEGMTAADAARQATLQVMGGAHAHDATYDQEVDAAGAGVDDGKGEVDEEEEAARFAAQPPSERVETLARMMLTKGDRDEDSGTLSRQLKSVGFGPKAKGEKKEKKSKFWSRGLLSRARKSGAAASAAPEPGDDAGASGGDRASSGLTKGRTPSLRTAARLASSRFSSQRENELMMSMRGAALSGLHADPAEGDAAAGAKAAGSLPARTTAEILAELRQIEGVGPAWQAAGGASAGAAPDGGSVMRGMFRHKAKQGQANKWAKILEAKRQLVHEAAAANWVSTLGAATEEAWAPGSEAQEEAEQTSKELEVDLPGGDTVPLRIPALGSPQEVVDAAVEEHPTLRALGVREREQLVWSVEELQSTLRQEVAVAVVQRLRSELLLLQEAEEKAAGQGPEDDEDEDEGMRGAAARAAAAKRRVDGLLEEVTAAAEEVTAAAEEARSAAGLDAGAAPERRASLGRGDEASRSRAAAAAAAEDATAQQAGRGAYAGFTSVFASTKGSRQAPGAAGSGYVNGSRHPSNLPLAGGGVGSRQRRQSRRATYTTADAGGDGDDEEEDAGGSNPLNSVGAAFGAIPGFSAVGGVFGGGGGEDTGGDAKSGGGARGKSGGGKRSERKRKEEPEEEEGGNCPVS